MKNEIEKFLEEYAGAYRAVNDCLYEEDHNDESKCDMCNGDKERMSEIVIEVEKLVTNHLLDTLQKEVEGNVVIEPEIGAIVFKEDLSTIINSLKR